MHGVRRVDGAGGGGAGEVTARVRHVLRVWMVSFGITGKTAAVSFGVTVGTCGGWEAAAVVGRSGGWDAAEAVGGGWARPDSARRSAGR